MASIFQRKDTGKYEISYKDAEGKRCRCAIYKTKPQALIALAKITKEIEEGTFSRVNKDLTFKDASERYINQYAKIHCKDSTVSSYEGYLNNHILPVFENKKMILITKPHIEEFIAKLKLKELSYQTINHVIFLTGAIFEKMIDDELIKINPVKRVKKLSINNKKASYLTQEEVQKCLETTQANYPQYYALLYTAIYSGLRQGELLALTWDDIDFDSKSITINKSFSKGQLGATKTASSIRNVHICPSLLEVLKSWQNEYKQNELNLVFPNQSGNYLDSRNILQRFLHPCLKLAGLKTIRWHDLRHTHISLLVNQNVAPQVIQRQAGHSTIKTTMDTYGHLMPSVYSSSIDAIDNIFTKRQEPKLRLVK